MPSLNILSKINFKEAVMGIDLRDLTKDGKQNLVVSTIAGDLRVYDFTFKKELTLECNPELIQCYFHDPIER